ETYDRSQYCNYKYHSCNSDISRMYFGITSFGFDKPANGNRNYNGDNSVKKSFEAIIIIPVFVVGSCKCEVIAISPIKAKRQAHSDSCYSNSCEVKGF